MAERLNTSASTVYRWLKRHGLPTKGWRARVDKDGVILVCGVHAARIDGPHRPAPGPLDGDTATGLPHDVVHTVMAAADR
ncbi:hypothetical protein DVS28_b0317 (plasmid) [Euzebya pacifica]|uniref:Uncharacterized protein n=1 Tax=Euzebya pacifica TaxID=1608957 RepID=A0A346Y6J0_9ACTN|nr:hypothetical protein DVS28_b0317 [Euzebya pacifica]